MKLTIPIPEKVSLNKIYAGVHWAKRKAWADDYHMAVLVAARHSRISAFSGPFPVHIKYRFKLRGKGLDSSNLAFMAKLLEDGLVACEIIPDDSPVFVRATTMIAEQGDDEVVVEIIGPNTA